jgi:hypothetical protein
MSCGYRFRMFAFRKEGLRKNLDLQCNLKENWQGMRRDTKTCIDVNEDLAKPDRIAFQRFEMIPRYSEAGDLVLVKTVQGHTNKTRVVFLPQKMKVGIFVCSLFPLVIFDMAEEVYNTKNHKKEKETEGRGGLRLRLR